MGGQKVGKTCKKEEEEKGHMVSGPVLHGVLGKYESIGEK